MLKAIKIRLYPSKEQEEYISRLVGSCRFVYNNLLAYKIEKYNTNKETVSFSELGKKLVHLKLENEWLKESHSKVLQQSLINLESAYKSFFKNGCGFPKFKTKHGNQTCRFPVDAIGGIYGNRINIIRQLKNIHFKCSKKDEIFLNKNRFLIKSGTLTKNKSGEVYFSILIDRENDKTLLNINEVIGIDLGIKDFIVDSNGKKYENIKIRRNNEKKLKKLHHKISNKNKGGKNREKARIKLAKFYNRLNNIKENYLHNISNTLLNENQVIVIETLSISNMMKNNNLAKSIQELSLFRFKQILKYKAIWYDRDIIEINQWFPSSKLCNVCNIKNTNLKLSDRIWKCEKCGTTHDRDFNAAINIRNEGKRIIEIK